MLLTYSERDEQMGHVLRTFPISGLGLGFPSCWSWSAVCRATSILSCPCASRCPPYAISSSHEIFFRILGRLILENLSWWRRLSIWHLASFAYEQSTYLPPWQSSSGAKWLATKLYLSWKSFFCLPQIWYSWVQQMPRLSFLSLLWLSILLLLRGCMYWDSSPFAFLMVSFDDSTWQPGFKDSWFAVVGIES